MLKKNKFLLLEQNYMSFYMLQDVEDMENIRIIHSKRVTDNRLVNLLYNIHHSGKIQKYLRLPFQGVWDHLVFDKIIRDFTPDYIIFTLSWYSDHLVSYFRENSKNSKLILRFSDMLSNSLGSKDIAKIEKIRSQFDGVLVYNQEDSSEFGFTYRSMGYSAIKKSLIKQRPSYDVVFIGAEKGRIDKIRQAYEKFKAVGLSCFFYVLLVKPEDRKNDGIIYADKIMPFWEYISYEVAAKCVFEIVQEGTSGRTYRMMESIIYNKLLITNCREIVDTPYYNKNYVQLFNDVEDIDPAFVRNAPEHIDFKYNGDFSPIRDLEFIENQW